MRKKRFRKVVKWEKDKEMSDIKYFISGGFIVMFIFMTVVTMIYANDLKRDYFPLAMGIFCMIVFILVSLAFYLFFFHRTVEWEEIEEEKVKRR